MKKKLTVIILLLLVLGLAGSAHAAKSWVVRASTAESILNDVCFTDPSNGWTVGDAGLIFRSTDRGRSFSAEASGTTENLNSVDFYDATNGWAVGTTRTVVKHDATGWTASQIPSSAAPADIDLARVQLTGVGTILVVAPGFTSGGTPSKYRNFFRSRDGGVSWEGFNIQNTGEAASGTLNYLYSVYFLDDSTGWVVGINNAATPTGKVFKTTNGAVTWQDVSPAGAANIVFRDVYFLNATTGWAVGGDPDTGTGYVYNSTDGGATWTAQYDFNPALFKHLTGNDANDLWISDRGSLFNFDGTNWTENSVPLGSGYFTSVNFVDPWNGWAVGGLLPAEGGPLRYIYKYVVDPYALTSDRILYITNATYEATLAFSGANIQSNATLTIEAAAGISLTTYEVKYESTLNKHKIDCRVTVDPHLARGGTYNFYVANPDEGTAGSGSFVLRESPAPADKPSASPVAEKVFDPATASSLDLKVATPGQLTSAGVRTSSVPPDVELELVVYRYSNRQVAYRKKFFANPSGYTNITLQKVTDLGVDISDGVYNVLVLHPRFGKIGSGVIVVHHSR